MNPRREIQRQHEDAVIAEFIRWSEAQGGPRYQVVARPDPPDAVLQAGESRLWVEVTDIYRSADEAHEERSHATAGETPFLHREHPIVWPDDRTADALVMVLKAKASSESYREAFQQYGRGVMICCERDPLFDENTLEAVAESLQDEQAEILSLDRGYFKEVYLYERASGARPSAFHRLMHFSG